MEITKKQQFLNDCKAALDRDNAGVTLFIHMVTGEEEMIVNPNVASKMAYIEKAYDEDLHLKSCPDIYIVEHEIIFPENEVMDFGVALMNLKEGHRIARQAWGDKMFMFLADEVDLHTKADLSCVKDLEGDLVEPSIILKTAEDKFAAGWMPSQADILAEDWLILDEEEIV